MVLQSVRLLMPNARGLGRKLGDGVLPEELRANGHGGHAGGPVLRRLDYQVLVAWIFQRGHRIVSICSFPTVEAKWRNAAW
jgi:hypothetical protein